MNTGKGKKNNKNTPLAESPKNGSDLKDMLLLSNDWIWEIEPDGTIKYSSGNIKEILGYEPEEIIGKKLFDLFAPEEKEKVEKELLKIIASEKPIINRITWNINKNGKNVCLLANGIPVFDEKKRLIAYRGVDKDITDQKVTEENLHKEIEKRKKVEKKLKKALKHAEEISNSRIEFIKKLSHEVRTPMNGIIGTIILLRETSISREQKEFLDIVETSANNLLTILNDVLNLSEIESGSIQPDEENFNLINKLNYLERKYSGLSKEKKIDFTVNIKPGVPKFLRGDSGRLLQILYRIIDNAFKFTKHGKVSVDIIKKDDNKDYVFLTFSVNDTGIGMHKNVKTNLFNELKHGKFGLTKIHGGTGLGLLICKQLVKLLDGTIGVESDPGKGSTFWFTLRFKRGISPDPEPMKEPEDEQGNEKNKLKILVAEDNIINQKVAMVNLRQHGHEVEIAVNGKMAVEMFKKNKYDLIFMDIQMPVLDGLSATREIRKIEKQHTSEKPMVIVAITANASEEDKANCLKNGMDHYIIKPFKPEDIDNAISLLK